ncbi:hypothetical protein V6N12_039181 [Hibiscus sabdariffa]|uniref:Uncharacterized protein n=1 Tax=Hibiscus sabdariffa TaxID=183260 RepID=A0ABR2DZX8_9ROSI
MKVLSPVLAFLALAVVASHAVLSPEQYWNNKLPNTPMPKIVQEILHPELLGEKSTSVNVGGGGVNVNTGKGKSGGTAVNVGKGGVHVNTGKGKAGGGTHVNVGGKGGGVSVNTGKGKPGGGTHVGVGGKGGGVSVNTGKGKPGGGTHVGVGGKGGGVSVNTGKGKPGGGTHVNVGGKGGGVSVNTGHKGKPVHVNVSPFIYNYAASETQIYDDPNVALFFLEKDMHPGATMTLHFTENTEKSTFLPYQLSQTIPFSSDKLPEIFTKFSVKPGSDKAEMMKNTIKECEQPSIQGEEKYCATSLESMIDFSTSKLGKIDQAVSTEVEKQTPMQRYTVAAGVERIGGDKTVVCHKQNYAYAVFYCHKSETTRAYTVPLEGADGTKAKAVAVCHTDTSGWNPKHLAFQVLKVEPGTVPICHFLPQDHIVWVPNLHSPSLLNTFCFSGQVEACCVRMVEVGGTEDLEFKWGKKKGIGGRKKDVQFYESFTYDGVDYALYDNVYLYKEGEPLPYLGKLIKIWENADKSKKVKVLWFFRPEEISNYLVDGLTYPNEIFLASGDGAGLANVNPLEAIVGKCNVICISKDSRNPQPSEGDIQMADFVFYRTFDVALCTIFDKIDEKIAGTEVKFIFNLPGSLKPSSVHNFSVDDKNASENAIRTNGRVILSKLNSSEDQIPEDDRQEEQKPAVSENLAPNDRQENDSNYKTASIKVEENSSVKPNISQREKLVSGVVTESGGLAKRNDRQENTSGDKTGFSRNAKGNANTSVEKIGHGNHVKFDEKSKSIKDTSELDERPHKKAKLDSSMKVSNDKESLRHPIDPRGTVKNSSNKLKIEDKPSKITNCKTPAMPPNDGKRTGDNAVEVTRMPVSDRSNWFGEIPWEERMRDAHEQGKLVLFQNLDPAYASADVEDIVWTAFKKTCRAKVVQQTACSSPHSGQAFAIFDTREVAEEVITKLDKGCLLLSNRRPLVASIPSPCFSRKQSMFAGHLVVDKLKSQREMKEALKHPLCSGRNYMSNKGKR